MKLVTVTTLLSVLALMLPLAAWPAENRALVLGISGNLIPVDSSLSEASNAELVIDSYYGQLSAAQAAAGRELRQELARLLVDYKFAFSAADTAEVNNLVSAIALCWAKVRTLHATEFVPDAVAQLRAAYGKLYPSLAADPAP